MVDTPHAQIVISRQVVQPYPDGAGCLSVKTEPVFITCRADGVAQHRIDRAGFVHCDWVIGRIIGERRRMGWRGWISGERRNCWHNVGQGGRVLPSRYVEVVDAPASRTQNQAHPFRPGDVKRTCPIGSRMPTGVRQKGGARLEVMQDDQRTLIAGFPLNTCDHVEGCAVVERGDPLAGGVDTNQLAKRSANRIVTVKDLARPCRSRRRVIRLRDGWWGAAPECRYVVNR